MRALLTFFFLCITVGNAAHALDTAQTEFATLVSVMKEYKNYPEYYVKLQKGKETYDDILPTLVAKLPPRVLEARYKLFNADYKRNVRIKGAIGEQLRFLKERLNAIPLSNYARRTDLELKYRSLTDSYNQARRVLFYSSIDANSSLQEALQMLSDSEKNAALATASTDSADTGNSKITASVTGQKMPGVFGGDKAERARLSEAEKINLTPVDNEFYTSQLGQKLASDLGGKAEMWSYDYETDELYVKVGKDIGKVQVKDAGPGVRFIQTRVGSGFREPAGSDTKVDMLTAEGKFLTGDANAESLFGKFPTGGPATIPEDKLLHKPGKVSNPDH
jgi:hypothetical protein